LAPSKAWQDGVARSQRGDWPGAVRALGKAVRQQPDDADAWLLLGHASYRAGDAVRAAEAAGQVCRLEPGHRAGLSLRLHCLRQLGRADELLEALEAAPDAVLSMDERAELADAQLRARRLPQAVQTCMTALCRRPADAAMHYRLGLVFDDLGCKAQAVECLRTALMLNLGPIETGVRDMLAFYQRDLCDWSGGAESLRAMCESAVRLAPGVAVRTNPFAHATLVDDPQGLLNAARANALYHAQGVHRLARRTPTRRERLRVGYLSNDFHHHATVLLMVQLLESHDRRRFEIFAYDHGRDDGSSQRRRVQSAVDHFEDVASASDAAIAHRVRSDGIDILVDLKGYTRGARPGILAHRAAPVQVAYLGFPGTTGSDDIDYIVGDRHVTPLEHAAWYTEKIAQLPGCYQCNDGTRPLPADARRIEHGLPDQALVLCGFNQSYKISPEVFDVWCRLLQRLPEAVLWLLDWNADATAALRREAIARGLAPQRLVFAPRVDSSVHLDRLGCADLFLDTWPCNGHTTASDMLWAGVPVLTVSGRSFASRVAGSLLRAVGVPELVCGDVPAYEQRALELAQDSNLRAVLRERVRAARLSSDLFRGDETARQLEGLYERMWERALAGLPTEHLPAVHRT
jgi:predicted O-linked N-acetylglucosamine transferase (SPINDLY family)